MFKKFASLFGAQDMTVGSPLSCFVKFSIPLLIGNIAQMLYTAADRIIVGRMTVEGVQALAAVSASGPILNLFLVFFMAIGAGVTIMVSQFYGAKDLKNLGRSIGNSITLIAVLSVVVTAIATPLTAPILRLLNTQEEIFDMSRVYLMILFAGSVGNGFYNVIGGILRGLGESVFPLLVLLGTVVLNVVLDVLFVAQWGLNLGIAGAAWATIIAQILSSVVLMIKLILMRRTIGLTAGTLRLHALTCKQLTRLGLPSGIQMAVMFLSNIVIPPYIMAMGTNVFAAMGATMSIDGFAIVPSQAFSMAASTYTGQNIGAGKMDRVKKGTKMVLVLCFLISIVMIALIQIFSKQLFGLFTDDLGVIKLGRGFILILLPAYLLMSVNMSLTGVMRGAGDSIGTMWISVITNVILKVPLTLFLIYITKSETYPAGSPNSMFISMPICMIVGVVISIVYYNKANWRSKAVVSH